MRTDFTTHANAWEHYQPVGHAEVWDYASGKSDHGFATQRRSDHQADR